MTTLRPFAANDFPLGPGLRLLEASAGTGKTFALAHLALRLVAEDGLPLARLLVVTFTEAAAAELRDRIGLRLQQALAALEHPGGPAVDAVLQEWLQRHAPAGEEQERALRARLLLALESLDAADITTIHGFCARTLARHALEAGRPPVLRIESDSAALVEEVVHDHWCRQVLPLPPHLVGGLRRRGVTPAAVAALLQRLDGDPALVPDPPHPALPPGADLPAVLPRLWQERFRTFTEEWQRRGRALEAAFHQAAAAWKAAGASPGGDYRPTSRTDRCGRVDALLAALPAEGDYEVLAGEPLLRTYFHPGEFSHRARAAEGGDGAVRLPEAPLLEAVAALVDGTAEAVLAHACHRGRAELRRRRQATGSTGFSQLLEALDPGPAATAPPPLLQAVAERYGAALIDEFQDTDPIQWRLLRLAFGGGDHPLVMVGDPKQAIYRFRGGDLDTYRQAGTAAGARYGLLENRRSTAALIGGLNALMAPAGLPRSELAVPEVVARAARGGPDTAPIELLWLGGERAAGEKAPSRTQLESGLPPRIAATVAGLLGRGLRLEEDGRQRPLRPDDLCLLVNTHHQAEQLRAALERLALPTRLVSRADVFASPAATALQRLLDALADPADGNRLRLLAASPLLGWSARRIATADGAEWSLLAGDLDRLARRLPRLGLPAVLAERLGSDSLARLALGGRLLADLQQVAELVQERLHG
ncbi:MAG: UvrD-helicase domain-containing protein, partial [Synechococcaceae cyanobacterium]|nr:UvrD-helicase domain-containing protein [Synechococcaceae cyanobacterium]